MLFLLSRMVLTDTRYTPCLRIKCATFLFTITSTTVYLLPVEICWRTVAAEMLQQLSSTPKMCINYTYKLELA